MSEYKEIVFYDNDEEKIISYRSGFSVYEEKFECGMLTSAGRNSAGFMLNVLDDCPTRFERRYFSEPQSFDFSADGFSLNGTWRFVSFAKQAELKENGTEVLKGTLILESTLKSVRVYVVTVLDGTEFMERSFTMENLSPNPIAISDVVVAGGGLEFLRDWDKYGDTRDYNKIYDIFYPEDCRWGHEGLFRWHPLNPGGTFVNGRFLCERHRHPIFYLRNRLTGSMFTCQLAFSGGYQFEFYLDVNDTDAFLSWRTLLAGTQPHIVLRGGERYTVPAVHTGYMTADLDDVVNTMHDHLRKSVFTLPDADGLYGIVSAGMGPERVMDERALKHAADTFAEMGAENLIVDAGWYCKAGDEVDGWWKNSGNWHADPGKHPDNMKSIVEYIHSKGLRFGLWLDLESAGDNAEIRKQHPEWMLKNRFGEETNILDFTNPVVVQWAENELSRVITEYGVELFRLDNNIHFRNFHGRVGTPPEGVYARFFKAVYEMYERLRRKFPNVVFENCAGGGGRTDLGLVKNFTHTWVSDWQKMPRGVAITNGMTMCLPPEYVDRLAFGMESHETGSFPIILRHTLFAKPTVNIISPVGVEMNDEQLEFAKHTLKIYKDFIRPFCKTGKIYHHTPEQYGEEVIGTCILERGSVQKDRSVIGVFRLGGTPEKGDIMIYPRGILPQGSYEVTFDNAGASTIVDGYRLVNKGIRVSLRSALTSELILIRPVAAK